MAATDLVLQLAVLTAGLAMLVIAGDKFVESSSGLASKFNVSPVVIGALVLGFGTSAPEMVVSSLAAKSGNLALGTGNVIGSNIANLSLVLGAAALLCPIAISKSVLRKEAPLALLSAAMFTAFIYNGNLSRIEGAILLVGLGMSVTYLVLRSGTEELTEESAQFDGSKKAAAIWTVVGLGGVLLGAHLAVTGATSLADGFGLSGGFIGFSLVALGTSLPELVTAFAAAKRNEAGLIVGSLFGSNIFNGFAVGGLMGVLAPGSIGDPNLTQLGAFTMVAVVAGVFLYGLAKLPVNKATAAVLGATYVSAMVLVA